MKPTILIVDDNPSNLELLEALMQAEEYAVVSAAGGAEALAKVDIASQELILLNIMMPKLDGYGVCRQLKERPETRLVPIVMITALGAERDRIRGIEAGADGFLTNSHAAAIRALRDEVAIGWRDAGVIEPFSELVKRNSLPVVPPAE